MEAQMSLALVFGIVLGVLLFYEIKHSADNNDSSAIKRLKEIASWIAWPGACFLRVMKSVDLPLIATSVVYGVSGIVRLKDAGRLGMLTLVFYLASALLASTVSLSIFLAFRELSLELQPDQTTYGSRMSVACGALPPSLNGTIGSAAASTPRFLAYNPLDDTLHCVNRSTAFDVTLVESNVILQKDPLPQKLGDVIRFVVDDATPDNVIGAFAANNVLGTVAVAIMLGLALPLVIPAAGAERNVIADFVMQLRDVAGLIAATIMRWGGPLAAMFLTAGAFASAGLLNGESPVGLLQGYGVLFAGLAASYAAFNLVLAPLAFFLATGGSNPFKYLAQHAHSLKIALVHGHLDDDQLGDVIGTCVEQGVPGAVAAFVLPLGVDLNLTGSSMYYPFAVLWLARIGGFWNALSSGTIAVTGLVSAASVIGAAHFPNFGLIMLLTIWTACFEGQFKLPYAVGVLFALDWAIARIIVVNNLANDLLVARIIAVVLARLEPQGQGKGQGNSLTQAQQGSSTALLLAGGKGASAGATDSNGNLLPAGAGSGGGKGWGFTRLSSLHNLGAHSAGGGDAALAAGAGGGHASSTAVVELPSIGGGQPAARRSIAPPSRGVNSAAAATGAQGQAQVAHGAGSSVIASQTHDDGALHMQSSPLLRLLLPKTTGTSAASGVGDTGEGGTGSSEPNAASSSGSGRRATLASSGSDASDASSSSGSLGLATAVNPMRTSRHSAAAFGATGTAGDAHSPAAVAVLVNPLAVAAGSADASHAAQAAVANGSGHAPTSSSGIDGGSVSDGDRSGRNRSESAPATAHHGHGHGHGHAAAHGHSHGHNHAHGHGHGGGSHGNGSRTARGSGVYKDHHASSLVSQIKGGLAARVGSPGTAHAHAHGHGHGHGHGTSHHGTGSGGNAGGHSLGSGSGSGGSAGTASVSSLLMPDGSTVHVSALLDRLLRLEETVRAQGAELHALRAALDRRHATSESAGTAASTPSAAAGIGALLSAAASRSFDGHHDHQDHHDDAVGIASGDGRDSPSDSESPAASSGSGMSSLLAHQNDAEPEAVSGSALPSRERTRGRDETPAAARAPLSASDHNHPHHGGPEMAAHHGPLPGAGPGSGLVSLRTRSGHVVMADSHGTISISATAQPPLLAPVPPPPRPHADQSSSDGGGGGSTHDANDSAHDSTHRDDESSQTNSQVAAAEGVPATASATLRQASTGSSDVSSTTARRLSLMPSTKRLFGPMQSHAGAAGHGEAHSHAHPHAAAATQAHAHANAHGNGDSGVPAIPPRRISLSPSPSPSASASASAPQ